MSYWHYQLGYRELPNGDVDFGIYEVYKDDSDVIEGVTQNPVSVVGESKQDIIQSLQMMLNDIEKHSEMNLSEFDEKVTEMNYSDEDLDSFYCDEIEVEDVEDLLDLFNNGDYNYEY